MLIPDLGGSVQCNFYQIQILYKTSFWSKRKLTVSSLFKEEIIK